MGRRPLVETQGLSVWSRLLRVYWSTRKDWLRAAVYYVVLCEGMVCLGGSVYG